MSTSHLRAATLALLLAWNAPRVARAEDAISYKHQDYRESGGRILVETSGAAIEKDLGTETHLKVEGILDAITGATPDGRPAPAGSDQVPVTEMHERRKAWNAGLSRQFSRFNLALGVGNSRESDYVSTGWSVNTLTDFNQKNTTLLVGVAGTDDDVRISPRLPLAKKQGNDVILGLTQLLDANTSLTVNLTWGRQTGYLADPYKLVQKNREVVPGVFLPFTFAENRPDERDKRIVLIGVNRSFPEVKGAVDATYRYYNDTFGIDANTIDLAWFQRLGSRVVLRPSFRFYDQTAASFYVYNLDKTSIVPVAGAPRPAGPFYSSDFRLSAFRSYTRGIKVIWNINDAFAVDASFERYEMHGRDGVTPQSAYCRANIGTVGIKFAW